MSIEKREEVMISVPLSTYSALLSEAEKHRILASVILSTAQLNYRREGLSFSDESIYAMLMATYPEDVRRRFRELQAAEEV